MSSFNFGVSSFSKNIKKIFDFSSRKKFSSSRILSIVLASLLTGGLAINNTKADSTLNVNGLDLSVGVSGLFNLMGVSQNQEDVSVLTGNFLSPVFQVNSNDWSVYGRNLMANVDRGKITFSVTGGEVNSGKAGMYVVLTNGPQVVQQFYVQAEKKKLGAFIIGNAKGVEMRSIQCFSDCAVGTGNIDGSSAKIVNITTGVDVLPVVSGYTGDSTKLMIFSPRIHGLQIAYGFTPNTNQVSDQSMNTAFVKKDPFKNFSLDVQSLALNHNWSHKDFSLDTSIVGIYGDKRPERPGITSLLRKSDRVLDLGFLMSWKKKIFFAGEFIYNGDSGMFINDDFGPFNSTTEKYEGFKPVIEGKTLPPKYFLSSCAGGAWIAAGGISLILEKVGFSLGLLASQKKTGFVSDLEHPKSDIASGNVVSFSAEYYLRKGISFYGETSFFRMKNPSANYISYKIAQATNWEFLSSDDNDAVVVLAGIKFQF